MDEYTKDWITKKSVGILEEYDGQITLRQLYYRLIALGMTNDLNHYKRVISAMTSSRWKGDVDFNAFIDRERAMVGKTKAEETDLDAEVDNAKSQIRAWMENYSRNRWENQPNYVEIWIEKKALQGVFESPCETYDVGLAPCKGYPSLTFLNEAKERFEEFQSREKNIIMLYFGDYDPSGEDIPRSIKENLSRMGCEIEVKKIALNPEQIKKLRLPSAPAKSTDTRSRNWGGLGVVELDAVEPKTLEKMCREAIGEYFDDDLYTELEEIEEEDTVKFRGQLKEYVVNLKLEK